MTNITGEYLTVAEYLAREAVSVEMHEYRDGISYLVQAGSGDHNQIISNLVIALRNQLPEIDYSIFPFGSRVKTPDSGRYMYPDLCVVTAGVTIDANELDTITNPSIIFEVLNEAEGLHDKGYAFFSYHKIPSLKEFFLIDSLKSNIVAIEVYEDRRFRFHDILDINAVIKVQTLGIEISLQDIYKGIQFNQ